MGAKFEEGRLVVTKELRDSLAKSLCEENKWPFFPIDARWKDHTPTHGRSPFADFRRVERGAKPGPLGNLSIFYAEQQNECK